MQLKEIMSPFVETIDAEARVQEAADVMAREHVGFLPVVLEGVCAGAITERDIADKAEGRDLSTLLVREIMSHRRRAEEPGGRGTNAGLISLPDHAEVEEAIEVMKEQDIHQIAVHDHEYRIVGVVSRSDLPQSATSRDGSVLG